jgi:hypothetical protein
MVLVAWHERRVASAPALPDGSDLQQVQFHTISSLHR